MTNIALVPGVLGFERLGRLQYFNDVAPHLQRTVPGVTVVALSTAPLGTVERRADVLADELVSAFGSAGPVHLVAHSMGGLDSRFLVSKDVRGFRRRVKTVACIGTPHLGSPVATVLDAVNPIDALSRLGSWLDELRSKTNAVHDLSETGARMLNAQCPDVEGVRYLEVVGRGRPGPASTSRFLAPMSALVRKLAVPNDGLVPEHSANRGRTPFAVWAGDHADLIGHDLDDVPLLRARKLDHLRAYEDLVRHGVLAAGVA
jgi:triacylglycerol lipase